jgi:Putative prokaryotic signal transducing protein
MNPQPEWTLLASFTNSYEAEFAATGLKESGIPVMVRGLDVGIWGPGHAGPTITGPSVWVPENRLEEARELLIPIGESAESEESG